MNYIPALKQILIPVFVLIVSLSAYSQDYRVFNIQINDICYSPVTDKIYAIGPGTYSKGNMIAVIHPVSGKIENYIPVGSEPTVIKVSDDGNVLFIGLFGSSAIQRFDLVNNTFLPPVELITYDPPPSNQYLPNFGLDIDFLPGSNESFVVAKAGYGVSKVFTGLSVFDDTIKRPAQIPATIKGGRNIAVSENGQFLWGFGHESSVKIISKYQINSSGIAFVESYTDLLKREVKYMAYQNDRVYFQNGQIFDISGTGAPTLLATIYHGQSSGHEDAPMAPAIDSNHIFMITDYDNLNPGSFTGYRLITLDKSTFSTLSKFTFPKTFTTLPVKIISTGKGRAAIIANDGYGKCQLLLYSSAPCQSENLNLKMSASKNYPCANDTLVLNADSGFSEYFWSNGATGQNASIVREDGLFWDSVRYQVIGSNGCLSNWSAGFLPKFEVVPGSTNLTLSGPIKICPNESTKLFASDGTQNTKFFIFSTGDTLPPSTPVQVFKPGIYSAFGISEHGCASKPTQVEVFPSTPEPWLPPAITVDGPLNLCKSELTTLSGPPGALGYLWSNGSTTQSIKPQNTNNYAVRIRLGNGCFSTWSDTVHLEIGYSPAQLGIKEVNAVLKLTNPLAVEDSIQWYRNGEVIAGAVTNNFTPSELGVYTVVNFAGGCPSVPSNPYPYNGIPSLQLDAQPDGVPALSYTLVGLPTPSNVYLYQWSTGDTNSFINVSEAGTYCLTVTQVSSNKTATSCIEIVNVSRLRASATYNANEVVGMDIQLFKEQNGDLEYVHTITTDTLGEVTFSGLSSGLYTFEAVAPAGSPLEQTFFPTYYKNALFWNEAYLVELAGLEIKNQVLPVNRIELLSTQMIVGPGNINGLVQELSPGFSASDSTLTPLAHVTIILFDSMNQPLSYVYSDNNGHFIFENIPLGTYYLYVNLPGVPPFFTIINITVDNPLIGNVVFTVVNGQLTVDSKEYLIDSPRIWPNPTFDIVYIFTMDEPDLVLADVNGRVVHRIPTSSGLKQISLRDYPSGIYTLIGLSDEGKYWVQKLVKL